MNREELVKQRTPRWERLQQLVARGERIRGALHLGPTGIQELAELYRALASDLMLVRRDRLGSDLERHLDGLASRAHNVLYAGSKVGSSQRVVDLIRDFPGAVRRNVRFFALASALFFGSGLAAGYAAYVDEAYALSILSPAELSSMESMYSEGHSAGRSEDTDALMTGFYVWNNVGIALRCFATGILYGLGPIFFLLFNGLNIGVVFGHLLRAGHGENLLSFVATHSSWELIAIVISGGAGLQMGFALVVTGGRTRLGNLQAHGLELLRQVAGAAAFLVIAAILEAWYSPSSLPVVVKYASGAVGWVAVLSILAFAGLRRSIPPDALALRTEADPKREANPL